MELISDTATGSHCCSAQAFNDHGVDCGYGFCDWTGLRRRLHWPGRCSAQPTLAARTTGPSPGQQAPGKLPYSLECTKCCWTISHNPACGVQGRLQRCAAANVDAFADNLELWQLEKLAAAFTVGRKNVKVRVLSKGCLRHVLPYTKTFYSHLQPHFLVQITELAIEAELPRTDVLAWLRQMEKAPEECVLLLADSCCICVSLQALCKDARLVGVACLTRQATWPLSLDLLKPRCQLA